MIEPLVILVDSQDQEIGEMNKLECHLKGVLHRAVSILIFNSKGEWLLQQRAQGKYHSPALWTNTSCSHPTPGEDSKSAAERRLREEMGMSVKLEFAFQFQYKAIFDNGLTENELDHVYFGRSDELPTLNKEEAMNFRYESTELLLEKIERNPENYTEWFKIMLPKVIEKL
jgi:isopentenyl-diphosphate delta-isomerase